MIFHFGRSPSVFSQPTRSETTPPPPLISQQKASLPISLKGSRSTAQRRGDLLMFGPTLWVTVWSGVFFFPFVCRCGGWPVATLEWFPEWIFTHLRRNRQTSGFARGNLLEGLRLIGRGGASDRAKRKCDEFGPGGHVGYARGR